MASIFCVLTILIPRVIANDMDASGRAHTLEDVLGRLLGFLGPAVAPAKPASPGAAPASAMPVGSLPVQPPKPEAALPAPLPNAPAPVANASPTEVLPADSPIGPISHQATGAIVSLLAAVIQVLAGVTSQLGLALPHLPEIPALPVELPPLPALPEDSTEEPETEDAPAPAAKEKAPARLVKPITPPSRWERLLEGNE